MERRRFLQSVVAAGGALAWRGGVRGFAQSVAGAPEEALAVKRVLAVFKCHLDVGFVDTQANVLRRYFKEFFGRAADVCAESRLPGRRRYRWTTGSWLLYEYLEQASSEERRRIDAAIAADDICWHALPFNWQTELLDRSQITASLALSKSLDRRYGKVTTGAKMTDVPGHTRGLVGPLAESGVTFLDIGANGASRPAELAPIFVWKNGRGDALTVMYHHNYGAVTQVPGTDLAIAIVVRHDNSGPHKAEEIDRIYEDLGRQFPNATVLASSLTDVARAVQPYESKLPVVMQEMGDTWIYGVASDPLKVARYREISRLRRRWIDSGELREGDATDVALLRKLLLEPEHTWGTDTKKWLDFDHYKPADLQEMLTTPKYRVVQASWREKREDLFGAVATLPPKLRAEAEDVLKGLAPVEHTLPQHRLSAKELEIETPHLVLHIDPVSGAMTRLRRKGSDREWASADHPLALLSYQTLSEKDFTEFFASYIIKQAGWVSKDFGKPNIERYGAVSNTWYPSVQRSQRITSVDGHRLLLDLAIEAPEAIAAGHVSFPEKLCVEFFVPHDEGKVHVEVSWFRKRATRMPESLWLTFQPHAKRSDDWVLDKCGEAVSPFDVAPAGARHMHAVSTGFSCGEAKDMLRVDTLDAPVLALGERSPLNFSREQPNLEAGVHCNLFNNAWGTNYIQWFSEDMRYRFVVSV